MAVVSIHPHAAERMELRGATMEEVVETINSGERFAAKYGRTGFRKNFSGLYTWRQRRFDTKQIEAYAVWENEAWLVITVIAKYF